jgi:hypothetical protein
MLEPVFGRMKMVFRMKKIRKAKNESKFWKLFRLSMVLFFMLLILGSLYYVISNQINELRSLEFSNHSSDQFLDSDRDIKYEHDKPFTLLLMIEYDGNQKEQIDGFIVIQLNSVSHSATVVSIHPNIYINSQVYCIDPDDTKFVRIKDLFVVGELQTPSRTCSYAVYSIEELLAVHIDSYIWVTSDHLEDFIKLGKQDMSEELFEESSDYESSSEMWNEYWIDYFDSISLWRVWKNRDVIPSIRSNIDVVSLYSFIDDFQSVKTDQIYSVFLSNEQLSEEVNNKGEVVDMVTEEAIDESLNGYLEDISVDREQARVELFNGSKINGLGARYERWLEHLGVDVIRVQNAPGEWEKTTIYVTDLEEFSYTLDKIIDLWGDDVKVIESRPDFITTGDVIIVLGLDFSEH